MKTLPKYTLDIINGAIDNLFNRLRFRFLKRQFGPKQIRITVGAPEPTSGLNLPDIFDDSSKSEGFNPNETLRNTVQEIADGYISAYQERARSRVINAVQAAVNNKGQDFETVLGGELADVFRDVSNGIKTVIESESTKARNISGIDAMSKVNTILGNKEPYVVFLGPNDKDTCEECKRLHYLPDGTPRVWKMSEINHGYHKKGGPVPSVSGLHPHCFVSETRISTDHGLLTIKELFDKMVPLQIVVDDRVRPSIVPANQSGKEVPGLPKFNRHRSGSHVRQTAPVFDTGVQRCVKITLDTGHVLKVSDKHEMWVDVGTGGKKIQAKELIVGQKIPLISGPGLFGPKDFPELSELMGNLLGDGCLGGAAQWNFFGDDIEYGKVLFELAKPYLLGGNIKKSLTIFPPNEKYSVPHARFNSIRLKRQFEELGLVSKKPIYMVPESLYSANKKTMAAFIRGLFAADACSWDTPAIVLTSKYKNFLQEIQLLLSLFGIVSRIKIQDKESKSRIIKKLVNHDPPVWGPTWRLIIGGVSQCELFAEEIGMGVPEKQRRLIERIASSTKNSSRNFWRIGKVESVEDIGEHQTYCLTEPMTNTVTANGVVTGQCRCTCSTILPGYGFKYGKIEYIGPDHNEYENQQNSESETE